MKWHEWCSAHGLGRADYQKGPLYHLIKETLGRSPLMCEEDEVLTSEVCLALSTRYARWQQGEPLAYILNTQPFLDLCLQVDARVLIPRLETEQWVGRFLAEAPKEPRRVLDVGTGSGCIALSLKQGRAQWEVWGCDKSMDALAVARANASALNLEVHWAHSDLYDGVTLPRGPWDYVLTNPPYLTAPEWRAHPLLHHEPREALVDRQGSGVSCYEAVFAWARGALASRGQLWCEHGLGQRPVLRAMAQAMGFRVAAVYDDEAGRDRVLVCSNGDGD